jgi:hypothetical protein
MVVEKATRSVIDYNRHTSAKARVIISSISVAGILGNSSLMASLTCLSRSVLACAAPGPPRGCPAPPLSRRAKAEGL